VTISHVSVGIIRILVVLFGTRVSQGVSAGIGSSRTTAGVS
jgi:hypothetical protein